MNAQQEDVERFPEQLQRDIPLSQLRLWTENPRDPLDGTKTNEELIAHALSSGDKGKWSLSKLAREMGPHYDESELPTVVEIEPDGPGKERTYRVYDGNRRVMLAMLKQNGFPEGVAPFRLPAVPDRLPCNVCDKSTALEHVLRKHRNRGTWGEYERDLFMYRYMGSDKSLLVRLQELVKAMDHWPNLNQRYVKEDVLNDKHLREMGLDPEQKDYGVSTQTLQELLMTVSQALSEKRIDTRNKRNNPASEIPDELLERIRDDGASHQSESKDKHNEDKDGDDGTPATVSDRPPEKPSSHPADQPGLFPDDLFPDGNMAPAPKRPQQPLENKPAKRRTRQSKQKGHALFGGPLALRPGDVNNIYLTLEELWRMNEQHKIEKSESFVAIFRMGLRLLAETAAKESEMELAAYIKQYASQAKAALRHRPGGNDIVTYLSSQSVNAGTLVQLLQTGAHGYTSSNNRDQALAVSIYLGQILALSHGR